MGGTLNGLPSARPPDAAPPAELPFRRILIVGIMGSGKSTVGRRLARELGWVFRDFDEVIEEEAEMPVARIFAEEGESGFRAREAAVAESLLSLDRVVLASGGGWPCFPGRMESLGADTLTIWLRVDPEAAVRRVAGGYRRRPLLEVPEPEATLRSLLKERSAYYALARWTEESDGEEAPAEVAKRLARRLRSETGRPTRA
jgi:shikimate kinase